MKTHLLDTTVLAALLNGRPAAVTLLAPLLARHGATLRHTSSAAG